MPSSKTIAIFDFDHTLLKGDSLIPFLKLHSGIYVFIVKLVLFLPYFLLYFLRVLDNHSAKSMLLKFFLFGSSLSDISIVAEKFCYSYLLKNLKQDALDKLLWHKAREHTLILVSASPEIYLTPFGKNLGFDHIIGTQLASKEGIMIGSIIGKNCYGAEKLRRLQLLVPDLEEYILFAYGDSKGDKEILLTAHHPYYRKFQGNPRPYPV